MAHPAPLSDAEARALLDRARDARAFAYIPYSGFPVGAALLAADGRVFLGCNVENASYSLTNCAERVALQKAVSEGVRDFRAIAVVGPEDDGPCAPCGACRQVMFELITDVPLLTPDGAGGVKTTVVRALLPDGFGPDDLARGKAVA